ncbi:hypothetical protein [uncultured Sphaerochaeta sp.]|uniref:hypothetical protein n=1 Tax=uncultured Sphaerochaeta sp. TaxID=886478 RepID=UPI002A0A6783|nr:hypothetical protein [uncultured Sphaerochaeta sp.]
MKTNKIFNHAVAQECVVLLNTNRSKVTAKVGKSWQPDVAQFLLDMFPGALDHGLELSDIAELVSEDDFPLELSEFDIFEDDDFTDDDFDNEEEDDL